MSDRGERLVALAAGHECDALLVTGAVNLRWLTGFTGTSGLAIVGAGGVRRFVTDFRYEEQAAAQLDSDWTIEIARYDLLKHLAADLKGPLRLGFDDAQMAVKQHSALSASLGAEIDLVTASGLVEELRAIKDPAEIAAIRASQALADEALKQVLERGLAGRTEQDVALDIEFTIRGLGAEGISFAPIVAHGAHGALPHAIPRPVEIAKDALCVIDWGAQVDGYASDCTRTYATGEISPEDSKIYELVLSAQLKSLAEVLPGAGGKGIDTVAREIIAGGGHGEHFGHGLGHGVGIDVHEEPRLSQRSDSVLAAGMVVTVEPGVYVPGEIGVRIEDLVVVTENGHEVLTSLPKELTVIEG